MQNQINQIKSGVLAKLFCLVLFVGIGSFTKAQSVVLDTIKQGSTKTHFSNLPTLPWPPTGETITVQDESGVIYTIDENGNVTITGAISWDNDNLDATANHQIIFKKSPNQTYGFDEKTYIPWTKNYPCIELSDGGLYFVPYKSVAQNQNDKVYAVIKSDQTFIPTFVQENATGGGGTQLTATLINDTLYEVTLGDRSTHARIYAYDDSGKKLGKLNLSVYAPISQDVVIVPVNGATPPSATNLENELNNIFIQANASFNVTVAANFSFDYDINTNGLDGADDDLLSNFSEEMKTLRDSFFSIDSADSKYYLFVVPSIEGDLDGYMVRGKSVGFVETSSTNRIYAHELAHGAFGLAHTFEAVPKTTSNNLLDYSNGSHLTHDQWYAMQHFTPVFSIFDDAEDGGVFGEKDTYVRPICDSYVIAQINTRSVFYNPVGELVDLSKLPGAKANRFYIDIEEDETARGSMEGFIYNGEQYVGKFKINDPVPFKGYFPKNVSMKNGTPVDLTPDSGIDTSHATKVKIECGMKQISFPGETQVLTYDCKQCFPAFTSSFFKSSPGGLYKMYTSGNSINISHSLESINDLVSSLTSKANSIEQASFLDEKQLDRINTFSDVNSGRKFVVVTVATDKLSGDENQWHLLARKVFLNSNLSDDDILITIPVYTLVQGNVTYKYCMPGLHFGSQSEIKTSDFTKTDFNHIFTDGEWATKDVQELRSFIDEVFKFTEKRLVVYEGVLQPNYSVNVNVYDEILSGYQQNCYIKTFKNSAFKDIENLVTSHKADRDALSDDPNVQAGPQVNQVIEAQKRYKRFQVFSILENADPFLIENYIPIQENKFSFKDEFIIANAEDYLNKRAFKQYFNYLDVFDIGHNLPTYSEPPNNFTWNREEYGWQVIDDAFYKVVDVSGIFLGFFGLDVITDGLGFVYASCRGDLTSSTTYASSVFIIGVSGGTINLSKNVINSGAKYIVKKEGGNYVIELLDAVLDRARLEFRVHADLADSDVLRLISYEKAGKLDESLKLSFSSKKYDLQGQIKILDDIAAELSEMLSFIDDLSWTSVLKNKLKKDINEKPGLLTLFDAEDLNFKNDLAASWKSLDESDLIPEIIAKNPDAVKAVKESMDEGLDGIDAIEDAIEINLSNTLTWPEILQNFKRGNDFNRKAVQGSWYDYHEIHLANGKRLDSYDPDLGEIISRKATDFDNIQTSTFENYLKEIDQKYAQGTTIRSDKYPDIDGQTLQGNKILEVPSSNLNSAYKQDFEQLASQYNVTIRYQPE